jgi:hypothetical protein
MRRLTAGLAAVGMLGALAGCAAPAPEAARPRGGQAATASHAWTVEAFEVSAEDGRIVYSVHLPIWVGR